MNNVVVFNYDSMAVRFSTDGWINATEVAKRYGKLPNEWLRLPDTRRYMDALAKALNAGKSRNLVKASRGRSGGTWIHPKLAVFFARWLNADFAVWADLQIDSLLRGNVDAARELDRSIAKLDAQNERGSYAGRELASHRWKKPPLEADVEYWRDQLQLKLEVAA